MRISIFMKGNFLLVLYFTFIDLAEAQTYIADPTTQREVAIEYLWEGIEVILDGRLVENFWENIEPISDFRQQEPFEGGDPSEETEIRIAHDGTYLYIGAILYDSEPDRVLGYQRSRNSNLSSDDRFRWILDTYENGRNAYYFETNPAGVKGDGIVSGGSRTDKSIDRIWNVSVVRGDYGWSVEAKIPFRSLNFDPDRDSWGINFQRTIRRKNEEILWSGYMRNQGLNRPQHAGRITGMSGLSQGLGLEVTPYISGAAHNGPNFDFEQNGNTGLDLTYSLTTNLRTSLTVNTDFAEIEVDDREVNLSRFPVSFPERRDFFLEAANVFQFSPMGGVTPFQSRQIGLYGGEPVPIRLGVRMAGQAGDYDIGFFQVRTGEKQFDEETIIPGEDFTAARLVRNIFSESTIGLLYTRRSGRTSEGAEMLHTGHTLGTDLDLATSRFLGDKNLYFRAYYIWHNNRSKFVDSSILDRSAYGVRLGFPNNPWSGQISYRELGEEFDPAMGFTRRRGFRRFQPTLNFRPYWDSSGFIRQLDWQVRFEYMLDMDYLPESSNTSFQFLGVTFESGDEIEGDIEYDFERLHRDFDILRNGSIIVPAGDYSGWAWSASASSSNHRMVSGEASIGHGTFWSGVRTEYELGITVRTLWGAQLSADWSHGVIHLLEGDFLTHLLMITGDLDLTTDTSFRANIQYDNLSERAGLFTRFRWIIRPGSDLFLVYTHNWMYEEDRFNTLEYGGAMKVTYTHQF